MKFEFAPDRMLANSVYLTDHALRVGRRAGRTALKTISETVEQFQIAYPIKQTASILEDRRQTMLKLDEFEERVCSMLPKVNYEKEGAEVAADVTLSRQNDIDSREINSHQNS